jgi:hypothetical protein
MKPKYNIGDQVWRCSWDSEKVSETCPECGGTKHLRVILWDGTEHTIACEGCKEGYYGPSGTVYRYERQPKAEPCEVTGVEIQTYKDPAIVEYRVTQFGSTYCTEEYRVFDNEIDALAKARAVCDEQNEADRQRVRQKAKDHRSWSWHVHYHRKAIRDAEKKVAYHTAALEVARAKAKEAA